MIDQSLSGTSMQKSLVREMLHLCYRVYRDLRLCKDMLSDFAYLTAMFTQTPIREIPLLCYRFLKVCRILLFGSGYAIAMFRGESIDRDGNPIPWFTYPCVEYLRQLDLSDKRIFEWGSGNSTLFWANKCSDVTSVENDPIYYQKIKSRLKSNVNLFLEVEPSKYIHKIAQCDKKFDIIVIDGPAWRMDCAQLAVKYLADDGIVILDNSDAFFEVASFLGDQNLTQVDFSGFSALLTDMSVTTIFFNKNASA